MSEPEGPYAPDARPLLATREEHRAYEDAQIVRNSPVAEALGAIDYETEMLDTVLGSLFDRLQPYRSERVEKESEQGANPRDRRGEHVERLYNQAARINSLAGAVRRVLHDLDL